MILINPGSGTVRDASVENATSNIRAFITESGLRGVRFRRYPKEDDRGRFSFRLYRRGHMTTVEMPGWPLADVRYVHETGQDVFAFPRLYVDGSSWLWEFALRCAIHELALDQSAEQAAGGSRRNASRTARRMPPDSPAGPRRTPTTSRAGVVHDENRPLRHARLPSTRP